MSPRSVFVAVVSVLLACSAVGCGSKKVVGTVKEQRPGKVTYSSSGDGRPVWAATGSARYTKTVPSGQSFDRVPHFTYVVFRDDRRGEDHIVTFEAAGEGTVTEEVGGAEVKTDGFQHQFRVFRVQPVQPPISVSLVPKPIELLSLSSKPDEPKVILTSDARVRLKYPSMWHLDDTFGLDEVKAIELRKKATSGGMVKFVLVEKEYEVELADAGTAAQHHADLQKVVGQMASHVRFTESTNWWPVIIGVLVVLLIIGGIIGKAAKK